MDSPSVAAPVEATRSEAAGSRADAGGAAFVPPHQFDTSGQQYSASKLGMWIFLATEILLFSGLFCAYAIYRRGHPELFAYGSRFLDTGWGAINTCVLLVSSFTMAMAVRCAQLSDHKGLKLHLALTLFLGLDFLGIKWIEYRHKFHEALFPGGRFAWTALEAPPPGAAAAGGDARLVPAPLVLVLVAGDAEAGRKIFDGTCMACHGRTGEGAGVRGISLPRSTFLRERDDDQMVAFLERGRPLTDPLNTTGLVMLPKGGNPALTKQDLHHVVAYLRLLQDRAGGAAASGTTSPPAALPPATPATVAADAGQPPSRATAEVRPGQAGPAAAAARAPAISAAGPDPAERPANLHMFFSIYFGMTGLHGLHVLAGMTVIAWLLRRACRGEFGGAYFFPVELGGLYWHLVDLIWIYLFPLLYLIQ